MKNAYLFILIFTSSFFYAQNNDYQITYNLTYVKDSLEQQHKYNEDFYLFLNKDKSYFSSVNKYKSDSTLISFKKEKNPTIYSILSKKKHSSNFKFTLEKNKDIFTYNEKIAGLGYFTYNEKNSFKNNWTLINESKKILDYNCNKASIKYGGRLWFAWYATGIPINDGPYKFNGLPGLILELEDSKSQYKFEVISIQQKEMPNDIVYDFSGNKITTKRYEFLETRKNYYYNPVKASNGRINYIDKKRERSFILRKRKNNNFIEIE